MKKSYRCIIKGIPCLEKTDTGKVKIWRTDGIKTACCEFAPSYFIWEKATRHNNYDAYRNYVHCEYVKMIN